MMVISSVVFICTNRQGKSNEDANKKYFFLGKVKSVMNKKTNISTKKLLKENLVFVWLGAHFPRYYPVRTLINIIFF